MTTDAIDHPRPYLDRGGALFLRIGTVMRLTGLGRSTIYRLMADENFLAPVRRRSASSRGVAATSSGGAKADPR